MFGQEVWEDFEDGGKLVWEAVNGTYNGIVENPDTTGENKSSNVGSYTKSGEHSFSLFRAITDNPIDLSVNTLWKVQVWSPIATEVLLKLEGGGAVEDRVMIQDSVWTTLSFDLSGGSALTELNTIILFFDPGNGESADTYLFDNLTAEPLPASLVLEDFEDGARLNWQALNGIYNGVVENPDTTGINKSTNVGSYTKSGENSFSLFLHEQEGPIDLSIFNKATIDIFAPEKTEFILKFEGDGEAREVRMNIPTANIWRQYEMDFSAAASFTTINKIILFFDPGVMESSDTYLFDNLVLYPGDECSGTEAVAGVVDNFECQRNATYDNGWDRLTVVDNPDASLVNSTAKVGAYSKPEGQAWATLIADYDNAIDLTTLNVLTSKIWSPVVDRVLFKLEGGASPAREIFIDIEESSTWVDMSADFSDYAAEDHKRLGIFFAAGTPFDTAVTFYVDEIIWIEKVSQAEVLEDFEDGPNLAWLPLNADAANGTFDVIGNPDQGELNASDSVGEYVTGTGAFSTLSAILLENLDLSENTQLNVDVWAPEGATTMTLQLVSPLEGTRDVMRDIPATGAWTTISFDFSSDATIADFQQINLQFPVPNGSTGDTYYIDNLTLGETTVDPCEGTEVDPLVVDDFECQRNATISLGADDLEVGINPDISAGNQSTIVGHYTEPAGPWAALVYESEDPFDLSLYNQLSMKIWAPSAVPILFKLEGGAGAAVEVFMDVTVTESWQTYTVDFSEAQDAGHNKLTLFMNAGQEPTVGEVYYWDDISWTLPPLEECIINFEGDPFNPTGWTYFANGTFADSTILVVPNPAPGGVNTSANVGRFVESAGVGDGSDNVQRFAGVFIRDLTPINWTDPANQTISMDVWMDHEAMVGLKVESGLTVGNTPDNLEMYTTPNEWQTMTWSFGDLPNDQWTTISLIFDFDNIPTENMVYYFDNIRVGGTDCEVTTSLFQVEDIPNFTVSPNPTRDLIRIASPDNFSRVEIYNAVGAKVFEIRGQFQAESQIDVSVLLEGLYFLQVYDSNERLAGSAKLIKH